MLLTGVMGTNGSGKTTLIRRLVSSLVRDAHAAVVVNELGEETYDDLQKQQPGLYVEGIRGGCIGCTLSGPLINLLKKIQREWDPAVVFVEPSEMVVAWRLRSVMNMGLRDMNYEIGPLIALVDGPDFELNWGERRDAVLNHVKDSDLVAISRTDLIEPDQVERIKVALSLYHNKIVGLDHSVSGGLEEISSLYDSYAFYGRPS